jgi:hypothetical protein
VVHTSVLVVAEVCEVLLPDVHHSPGDARTSYALCLSGVWLKYSRHIKY